MKTGFGYISIEKTSLKLLIFCTKIRHWNSKRTPNLALKVWANSSKRNLSILCVSRNDLVSNCSYNLYKENKDESWNKISYDWRTIMHYQWVVMKYQDKTELCKTLTSTLWNSEKNRGKKHNPSQFPACRTVLYNFQWTTTLALSSKCLFIHVRLSSGLTGWREIWKSERVPHPSQFHRQTKTVKQKYLARSFHEIW